MTNPTFTQWVAHWWQKFDAMECGTAYECGKCAKSPELFVEVCKEYIDHSEHGECYEFDQNYLFFKRFTNPII